MKEIKTKWINLDGDFIYVGDFVTANVEELDYTVQGLLISEDKLLFEVPDENGKQEFTVTQVIARVEKFISEDTIDFIDTWRINNLKE